MTGSLTPEQIAVLLKPIKPGRVAKREGLSNVEGYEIRAHLTRIFGFGRWDDVAVNPTVLLYEQPTTTKKGSDAFKVAYRAERALVIRDQDGFEVCRYEGSAVGESIMPDFKRGDAHDMAIKTAETQALKRAAVNLGDQFGLSLYAKGATGALVGKVVGFEQVEPAPDMHEPDVVEGYDPDVADEQPEPEADVVVVPIDQHGEPESQQLPLDEAIAILEDQIDERFRATPAQIRKVQTMFGVMGVKEREKKIAYLCKHAGRTVASSKELTMDEAMKVIDQMEKETTT